MDQLSRTSQATGAHDDTSQGDTGSRPAGLLLNAADAIVVLEPGGGIVWQDERFSKLPIPVQDRCRQWCVEFSAGVSTRTHIEGAGQHWEVILRPSDKGHHVCLLLEVTHDHTQQLRLDAVDQAGLMLLHFDRDEIASLNIADRLRVLEERIISSVKRELKFDHFEIRLRAPGSDRLELVISENLSPMRIGETISVSEAGNGISGWVAATGKSYVCGDVRKDPMYREGLDDARSSLTVPLRVHGKVIGVFNIESDSVDVFTEDDRILAERFAGYIASVLHLLDLLVVARIATNEQVSRNMSSELERPISDLQGMAARLRGSGNEETAALIQQITVDITNRIAACAAGPRSIIDAEHEIHAIEPDTAFQGLKVLVVDDEDRVRSEVAQVLRQLGCAVTTCENGLAAFTAIEMACSDAGFALVVSDIRLPDASGYEVFTKTRQMMPEVPVILMTGFGYDPDHTIVRASADGVQGILLKPFRTSQLVDAVRNAFTAEIPGRAP